MGTGKYREGNWTIKDAVTKGFGQSSITYRPKIGDNSSI